MGKFDTLRGSLAWLIASDVICANEVNTFWRSNQVAHELAQIVGGSKPETFDQLFKDMLMLLNKIQRWWVTNFDVASDPEWDGVEIDPEEVIHGSTIVMQIFVDVALGDDDLSH